MFDIWRGYITIKCLEFSRLMSYFLNGLVELLLPPVVPVLNPWPAYSLDLNPNEILMKMNNMRIHGKMLRWIHAVLTDRTIQTTVDGFTSSKKTLEEGPRTNIS